jgi:DNA-binding NarL/FixJ family response regulator
VIEKRMTSDTHRNSKTQPVRVLIADDNARSRSGLRALLGTVRLNPSVARGRGARDETWPEVVVVGEAANGREAVGQVAKCRPDVVLIDIRMPVMNGLEATQYIKSHWPEVKVIALTMYSAYRAEALAAGVDAFLIKGSPVEELLGVISHPS